jgi:hypothetical protein
MTILISPALATSIFISPGLQEAQAVPTRSLGAPLWDMAGAVPSLDLNFAATKNLVDATTGAELVTFTRASSGTYVDSQGVIQIASTDEPRFDHDPTTGESLGLLVEEQRSNSIRNNTMVGAVAGTPGTLPTNWGISGLGTLTRQIIGIGSINGIAYIDVRVSGTSSTSQFAIRLDSATAISATNGQTWAVSSWFAVVGGSLTNIGAGGLGWLIYDSGAGFLGGSPGSVPLNNTSTLMRLSYTDQITTANTAFIQPQIFFLCSSGAAIDITLRIGLPQLEQGAFATSVIPTSGAAATRAADVATITGTNFSSWYRQDEGTVFADVTVLSTTKNNQTISIDDGTSANRIELRLVGGATNIRHDMVAGGVVQHNGVIAVGSGLRRVAALGYKSADTRLQSGSTGQTFLGPTVPAANQIRLNYASFSNGELNGTIRRLVYWGQRLPNNVLQAITQ